LETGILKMADINSINFLGNEITLEKLTDDDEFLSSLISKLPIETKVLEVGAGWGEFTKKILERFHNALIIEGEEVNYQNLLLMFPEHTDKIKKHVIYNDDKEHNWYFATGSCVNALVMPLKYSKIGLFTKSKVTTVTLDSIDFNFDFIKTDCEGADFNILLGATRLIAKNKPLIYMEHSGEIGARNHNYTKDNFFDFFEKNYYSLFLANGDQFLPSMWYTDTMKDTNSYNLLAVPTRKKSATDIPTIGQQEY
jgi:FkbM family methyltransferase